MFQVDEPTLVHEFTYRSSGSNEPRDMSLQIYMVRYRSDCKYSPTFLATADLQGREKGVQNRLVGELLAEEISALQELDALPRLTYVFYAVTFTTIRTYENSVGQEM